MKMDAHIKIIISTLRPSSTKKYEKVPHKFELVHHVGWKNKIKVTFERVTNELDQFSCCISKYTYNFITTTTLTNNHHYPPRDVRRKDE